jgi:hypothetical protein
MRFPQGGPQKWSPGFIPRQVPAKSPHPDLLPEEKEKASAHFDNGVVVVATTALRLFVKTSRSSVRIGKVLSDKMFPHRPVFPGGRLRWSVALLPGMG